MVALIVAPGLTLGYFGFRALAEREHSLRTDYTATTVLVPDRLAFQLRRFESSLSPPATQPQLGAGNVERLAPDAVHSHADGSVLTAGPQAGMLPQPGDALATLPAVAAAVFDAERQDPCAAISRRLSASIRLPSAEFCPDVAARAFELTRIGRTLFKLRRLEEGIARRRGCVGVGGRRGRRERPARRRHRHAPDHRWLRRHSGVRTRRHLPRSDSPLRDRRSLGPRQRVPSASGSQSPACFCWATLPDTPLWPRCSRKRRPWTASTRRSMRGSGRS